MSKVFEALQRLQQKQNKEENRDPLAARIGSPDVVNGDNEPENANDNVHERYELPSLIGAPTGPRSNEGMIFPSVATNGKSAALDSVTTPVSENGVGKAVESLPGDRGSIDEPKQREIRVETVSPIGVHPRLILLTEPEAPECEQYLTLRTELFQASAVKATQIVVVTSALAGEGKTSTVLNLALAISQSQDKRVLVIDGDLRRPSIASFLGLRPSQCLGEVLISEADPLESIICVEGPELYVLPVSREYRKPTDLLASDKFVDVLSRLREYFDYIIIDSPPVLPFADSRLLANLGDAVIMVVRAGMTPYETFEKAVNALPQNRILGVVLNGASQLKEAGYYDYYYNYTRRESRWRQIKQRVVDRLRGRGLGKKMGL